ncbi:MAG: peptidylprolyl isomerase, partial [Saprospiraceae bacterium]
MVKYLFAPLCLWLLFVASAAAQTPDPVLFTVDGHPVTASEFTYIYSKTNQDKADFSEASLREYLDLYTKFKLKVQRARDMQLDTISSLRSELDGYRRQLANSYLVDREVTDKLIKETYDRMLRDVDISHILIAVDRSAKPADTLRAYNRAMALLRKINAGSSFDKMAMDSSEDKSVKENRGNLGFVTAMLPDGYYDLEKAIYAAKPGAIVGPVRTSSGYHLVRVNAFRPARGEVEVSQILFRKGNNEEQNTGIKMRADSVYKALKSGAKWEDLVTKYTDDKATASKGGYIGFFGINRYQKNFEDAAFGLQNDGDFSAPVESSIGWHIIKRVSLRPIGPFETAKRGLSDRVKRDSRNEVARQSMISRIKREGNFQEYPAVLQKWMAKQKDTVFLTFRWKPDPAKPQDVLMRFGESKVFTVADFEDYAARASRERMRGSGYPLDETVQKLYSAWTEEVAMQFEEGQLDRKYPEFKSLMREYEEGILLFEALKQNVWDRANIDSVGLAEYFKSTLSQKYKWDERADVSIYTIKTDDPKMVEKVRAYAAKKPAADVLKKFNKAGKPELVSIIDKYYEKGKNK